MYQKRYHPFYIYFRSLQKYLQRPSSSPSRLHLHPSAINFCYRARPIILNLSTSPSPARGCNFRETSVQKYLHLRLPRERTRALKRLHLPPSINIALETSLYTAREKSRRVMPILLSSPSGKQKAHARTRGRKE